MIKAGEHVSEMMAVAVKKFQIFLWSGFLIIRQNVNIATNAILNCGLSPKIHLSLRLGIASNLSAHPVEPNCLELWTNAGCATAARGVYVNVS